MIAAKTVTVEIIGGLGWPSQPNNTETLIVNSLDNTAYQDSYKHKGQIDVLTDTHRQNSGE